MERRRRAECDDAAPPSPPPNPSPFLRDVSNYKTPRPHFPNPNPDPRSPLTIFFTASKKTPSSSFSTAPSSRSTFRRRASAAVPPSHSKAARRLKALEFEQSKSSQKARIRHDKALISFSKSISAWLNFLFKNPKSCGCNHGAWSDDRQDSLAPNGKRESLDGGGGIGVGGRWRSPKRQRDCSWKGSFADDGTEKAFSMRLSSLKASLQDVCSFVDMKDRMEAYISQKGRIENIDEGRLKMMAHCPVATDLGVKEKAIRVLMCYNPIWLRIGLHIVFGGDSLLLNEEGKSDQEDHFLKMIIEKHFFAHMGIAKSYAYNKLVEGLYRPGYFEALGNIILKRLLLLVISLDKAKCESLLPLKYGIDGIDGGSALLFCHHSHIKSSRQVIHEFLSEVMHGEGSLLAHLVILGYKVNYQQFPLSEYDFNVRNLFEDLQDGILLCRSIQLLQCDASILSKVVAPSDTRKKNLHNCTIAMQYLKQVGVSLSDGDGVQIVAEDIVNGDKELTLSILWNMFVHLQDCSKYNIKANMSLLLEWIQGICEKYCVKVDNFSSLINGEALCCLIDYYSGIEVQRCSSKVESNYIFSLFTIYFFVIFFVHFVILYMGFYDIYKNQDECHEALIRRGDTDSSVAVRNFVLVQKITAMLGNIPEVLQIGDILDNDASYDERSVIILLVFLASQLIHRKKLDQLRSYRFTSSDYRTPDIKPSAVSRLSISEDALHGTFKSQGENSLKFDSPLKEATLDNYDAEGTYDRYITFIIERHRFLQIKKSVLLIQQASHIRGQIMRSRYVHLLAQLQKKQAVCSWEPLEPPSLAAIKIQRAWKRFTTRNFFLEQRSAAIKIQSNWRSQYTRMSFVTLVGAIIKIQAGIRSLLGLATELSKKCCETLVSAGAVNILLKQIHSLNRGVPDQEVLKHILCTLRNIIRHPQLLHVLINTPQSVEIIFQELLRNKSEGFFIAAELLKKMCSTQEGLHAVHNLQGHLRRLNFLAQDLERKIELQKRNARLGAERDMTMQRFREIVNLLLLVTDDDR
ncbi:putative protein abnormal spindle [Cocos nucifera]|uniref:Calponin-homology (CH) domain-containing protein n=1 Tax=Cocos nucifera TaxID=13894 RepID=A0A8K0IBM1_COCNU|nr:putative protein abnormal spindle [Cocos nucifera]